MNFLTTAQAAERLRVSAETVRDWVREGHLRAFRIGPHGQLRLRVEDVEAAMREAREPAAAG